MSLIGAAIGIGASLIGQKRADKKQGEASDTITGNLDQYRQDYTKLGDSARTDYQSKLDEAMAGISPSSSGIATGGDTGARDQALADTISGIEQRGLDSISAIEGAFDANMRDPTGAIKESYGKGHDILAGLKPQIDKFAEEGASEYQRYKEMAGPLEDSLSDYYNNLNPDELAAQGNQSAQQQYQASMNQVNEQMAASGMSNAGASAQMAMQQGNAMAQTKASNQMNAPHQVAQMQQGWLGYAGGQKDSAQNMWNTGTQMQSNLGQAQSAAYQNEGNALGSGISAMNSANAGLAAAQGNATAGMYNAYNNAMANAQMQGVANQQSDLNQRFQASQSQIDWNNRFQESANQQKYGLQLQDIGYDRQDYLNNQGNLHDINMGELGYTQGQEQYQQEQSDANRRGIWSGVGSLVGGLF